MVDPVQVALGLLALSLVVAAPIGFLALYDLTAGRWDGQIKRWRSRREEALEHRRAVKALRRQHGIPIEQLAADLRRLRTAISNDEHRSAAHQMGNRLAYDQVLTQACDMLDIPHELGQESTGLDRDIERFRLEAELERAGVVISTRRFGQAA